MKKECLPSEVRTTVSGYDDRIDELVERHTSWAHLFGDFVTSFVLFSAAKSDT